MSLLFVAKALAGEHHFASPNGEFEAYTIAANEDGTGMKLFLRRANSTDAGVLLRQNNRWIDAKWSPDSRFLAVMDHLDGHISDVYIFAVAAVDAGPDALLSHARFAQVRCAVGGNRLECIAACGLIRQRGEA